MNYHWCPWDSIIFNDIHLMNMKIKKNLQHKSFAGKIMKVLQWRSALTMKFKFWAFISSLQSLALGDITYLLHEWYTLLGRSLISLSGWWNCSLTRFKWISLRPYSVSRDWNKKFGKYIFLQLISYINY